MAITDIQSYFKDGNSGLLGGMIVEGAATAEGKSLSSDHVESAR